MLALSGENPAYRDRPTVSQSGLMDTSLGQGVSLRAVNPITYPLIQSPVSSSNLAIGRRVGQSLARP